MSTFTRKYLTGAIIFTTISLLFTCGPAIYYLIVALLNAELVVQKAALVSSVFVAIIGSLICLISKTFSFRSRIWVFLLAIMFCIDSFGTMIIIFAVTQIVDELVFSPLAKHYRSNFSINRSIDLRVDKIK